MEGSAFSYQLTPRPDIRPAPCGFVAPIRPERTNIAAAAQQELRPSAHLLTASANAFMISRCGDHRLPTSAIRHVSAIRRKRLSARLGRPSIVAPSMPMIEEWSSRQRVNVLASGQQISNIVRVTRATFFQCAASTFFARSAT